MVAYATRRHVYAFGLPRGTVGMQARLVARVDPAADLIELDEHGFEDGDQILVRPAGGSALPAPLAEETTYFAIRRSATAFQLAATAGGAAIDLTTAGGEMFALIALPFDEQLELYSRWVDGCIPQLVPLTEPYDLTVVATVAELTAAKLQILAGTSSASMKDLELGAKARLERWAAGAPLRSGTSVVSSNRAIIAAPATRDARGWGSRCLP